MIFGKATFKSDENQTLVGHCSNFVQKTHLIIPSLRRDVGESSGVSQSTHNRNMSHVGLGRSQSYFDE